MFKKLLAVAGLLLPLAAAHPALAESQAGHHAEARVNLAAVPIGRMSLPWWRERFERSLARVRQGHVHLIWLGDSITENWERAGPQPWADYRPAWNRFYGDRAAVNMGFMGDTTASVIWRLDHGEVAGLHPKALILLIGANNFGLTHWDAEKTLDGIEAIIRILRHKLPETKILLLGVLPSARSPWITENTQILNAMLQREFDHAPGVTFLNVGYLFYRNGHLNRSLYLDPHEALAASRKPGLTVWTVPSVCLHPDAQGMALIAQAIEPTLHRLMGDQDHRRQPAG
jgi:lysophospholipase L1-like esterase